MHLSNRKGPFQRRKYGNNYLIFMNEIALIRAGICRSVKGADIIYSPWKVLSVSVSLPFVIKRELPPCTAKVKINFKTCDDCSQFPVSFEGQTKDGPSYSAFSV